MAVVDVLKPCMGPDVDGKMEESNIKERLNKHASFISHMLNLIPAKHYVNALSDEHRMYSSKFMHNKKDAVSVKEKSEKKKKAKLAKFDPEVQQKSVEDVKAEKAVEAESEKKNSESGEGDQQAGGESSIAIDSTRQQLKLNTERVGSLDALREKLHNRIAALRGKRKVVDSESNEEQPKGKKAKLSKKKEAKAAAEAANRKKRNASEVTVSYKDTNENGSARSTGAKGGEDNNGAANAGDAVVYSKFDFGKMQSVKEMSKDKGAKNYQALLDKAQKSLEKDVELKKSIVELEKKESELDESEKEKLNSLKAKAEQIAFTKAAMKAKGEKTKDDPKLLKKTLKRIEQKKTKSAKVWQDRKQTVESSISDRQKKRNENLLLRKHSKKRKGEKGKKGNKKYESRMSDMKKKNRPGFEASKKVAKK
eukprot:Nk52_evm37s240 gene=Nk52_evmTU37s240